jgi:porin
MKGFAAVLTLFALLTLTAAAAPGAENEPHPNTEALLRVPIDTNSRTPSSHVEGVLGSCFPRIHGNDALHFDYTYTGGVFNNARGGAQTKGATAYVGIFDFGITADTEKWGLWKNGTFYMHSLFSHGVNPSGYIGDSQGAAVIAYETPAQVAEYWYEHQFFDKTLNIRAGKMDAGTDFFYLNAAENFFNGSGTCVPTTGIPTAPNNAWGILTHTNLTENICLKFGLFDADADANKFWMSESGNLYTAYQVDCHHNIFCLPGFAYAGVWYNDSETVNHFGEDRRGNAGYSIGFEQMIYKADCRNDNDLRGLTFFAHFSETHRDRDNFSNRFFGTGFSWLGFFSERPDDVLGFGIFSCRFDNGFRQTEALLFDRETVYELFYHLHLSADVAVQPMLQYIVHPGGLYKNSLVPGIGFQVTF